MTLVLNVLMCGYLKFNEEGIHQADYLHLNVLIHTISSSLSYEVVIYSTTMCSSDYQLEGLY